MNRVEYTACIQKLEEEDRKKEELTAEIEAAILRSDLPAGCILDVLKDMQASILFLLRKQRLIDIKNGGMGQHPPVSEEVNQDSA